MMTCPGAQARNDDAQLLPRRGELVTILVSTSCPGSLGVCAGHAQHCPAAPDGEAHLDQRLPAGYAGMLIGLVVKRNRGV